MWTSVHWIWIANNIPTAGHSNEQDDASRETAHSPLAGLLSRGNAVCLLLRFVTEDNDNFLHSGLCACGCVFVCLCGGSDRRPWHISGAGAEPAKKNHHKAWCDEHRRNTLLRSSIVCPYTNIWPQLYTICIAFSQCAKVWFINQYAGPEILLLQNHRRLHPLRASYLVFRDIMSLNYIREAPFRTIGWTLRSQYQFTLLQLISAEMRERDFD